MRFDVARQASWRRLLQYLFTQSAIRVIGILALYFGRMESARHLFRGRAIYDGLWSQASSHRLEYRLPSRCRRFYRHVPDSDITMGEWVICRRKAGVLAAWHIYFTGFKPPLILTSRTAFHLLPRRRATLAAHLSHDAECLISRAIHTWFWRFSRRQRPGLIFRCLF